MMIMTMMNLTLTHQAEIALQPACPHSFHYRLQRQLQQSRGTPRAIKATSGDTAHSYVFAAWWKGVCWTRNVQIGATTGPSVTASTSLPFSSLYASNSL